MKFEVKDQFELNGKPFKILSGAVHYFRIHPSQWADTLYNLKALGFNTVETYIPWNRHEPQPNQFDFSGQLDIEKFIQTAQALNLYVILRPSPFICAEWEFGGLPAWLLNRPNIRLRANDPQFLAAVEHYYQNLLPHLVPYQVSNGGPVLMMQIENEYGSFGEDQAYLKQIRADLKAGRVTVPLFTSDGTWPEALDAGTLIDDNVLVTGNFGSHAVENFDAMTDFFTAHHQQWPLMCMEYWDGWFSRWGEPVIRRDIPEMIADLKVLLQRGSLNLYMFRGGTNFGFMNGCSARKNHDLPQVTSYDYDAILSEAGVPTEKYFALQTMLKELWPDLPQTTPRTPKLTAYTAVAADGQVGLLTCADYFTTTISRYPLSFEQLSHYYGYVLYRTTANTPRPTEALKVIDANDNVQLFANQRLLASQTGEAIGDELTLAAQKATTQIDALVENQGRVNYGYKLQAPSQRKGIKGGVMVDHQFQINWQQILVDFDQKLLARLPYQPVTTQHPTQPTLTHFTVHLAEIQSTFIDCSEYEKGCIIVNGTNIGRYWARGPIHSLYVPAGLLKSENEIVVFETEYARIDSLKFLDHPLIDQENPS